MKTLRLKIAPLLLLILMVSCNKGVKDRYAEGLEDGKAQGYQEGYGAGYNEGEADGLADGDAAGYERAKTYFESAGFNEGFSDGKKVGTTIGYNDGYSVGKNETYNPAFSNGYNVGYSDGNVDGEVRGYNIGYDDGYQVKYDSEFNRGYNSSYQTAYNRGNSDGKRDGYNTGYVDGKDDGYDSGYDDGYSDAYVPPSTDDDNWYSDDDSYDDDDYYADDDYDYDYDYGDEYDYDDDYDYDDYYYDLSIGKSKKLRGFANVLSLAHNDMIDYTKIARPRFTAKGILVKGKVLMSETSLTNKDTLKRAAAAEQYLVIEMAKQVKSKFGLSADRSLKVAKAANHFRKQSSRRALTSEDTNAYATEIIGSDFTAITKAYEKTLKGDTGAFTDVLNKAAEKNGTSPENISVILAKYFM